MRLIPFYFAFTGAVLALFIVIEAPTAPSLEEFGAGKAAGIILGVFFGCLLICYIFFVPFFKRKLIMKDPRVRIWHVILGPMLLKENVSLFWPGKGDEYVTNYYEDAYGDVRAGAKDDAERNARSGGDDLVKSGTSPDKSIKGSKESELPSDPEKSAREGSTVATPPQRKSQSLTIVSSALLNIYPGSILGSGWVTLNSFCSRVLPVTSSRMTATYYVRFIPRPRATTFALNICGPTAKWSPR